MSHELTKVAKLAWRKHLQSPAGIEGMLVLRQNAPSVGRDGEAHSIVFDAGVAEGWRRCLSAIYEIASATHDPDSVTLEPN